MDLDFDEVGGEQYGLLLATLATSVGARRVLEIGAGWGWSALAFSRAMTPPALIVSLDTQPDRVRAGVAAEIASSGVHWKRIAADSQQWSTKRQFDILYIDGDPANAQADLERFYPNVKPGGLVILDGVGGQCGPTELVEQSSLPWLTLPYSDIYSHAIYRKPAPPSDGLPDIAAHCADCGKMFRLDSWSAVDGWADAHVNGTQHSVEVFVGPRNLRYKKGAR